MAAIHYHAQRTYAERELDAAYSRALRQCLVLQQGADALGDEIELAKRKAAAAGIFEERIALTAVARGPRSRSRRALRTAARTALARATLPR